jgi:Bacterial Ig-like domain (group 3)
MKGRCIALLFDFFAIALLTASGTFSFCAQTRRVSSGAADSASAYSEAHAAGPEQRAETSVSLGSNPNPGYVDQPVDFIGIVSSSKQLYAGGTMTFYCNGQVLAVVQLKYGVDGFLTTTFSAPGTYKIKARYNGDETHKPSSAKMFQSIITFAKSQ